MAKPQMVQSLISGIKCDAPGCDFVDPHVSMEDYAEWLNRPCPKCASNLLTEADLETVRRLLAATDALNDLAVAMIGADRLARAMAGDVVSARVRLNMNGSGEVNPELMSIVRTKGAARPDSPTAETHPDTGHPKRGGVEP